MRSQHPELASPEKRRSDPLATVSWPWVPACGSLEPPRSDGENAHKTGKNGEKMGEIQPKMCEGREALVQQLQWLGGRVRRRTEYKLPKFSTKTEEKVARNLQFSPALISPLVRHPRGRPNQTINWQLWAGGQVGRWAHVSAEVSFSSPPPHPRALPYPVRCHQAEGRKSPPRSRLVPAAPAKTPLKSAQNGAKYGQNMAKMWPKYSKNESKFSTLLRLPQSRRRHKVHQLLLNRVPRLPPLRLPIRNFFNFFERLLLEKQIQ